MAGKSSLRKGGDDDSIENHTCKKEIQEGGNKAGKNFFGGAGMMHGSGIRHQRIFTVLFCFLALAAFAVWAPGVHAESGFYSTNCGGCHTVTSTCNGCHGHGVHSSTAQNDFNLRATANKATYTPGEAMTVTLIGGYRNGWVRALLRNDAGVIVSRSTPAGSMGGVTTSVLPYTFTLTPTGTTLTAPTTPGTYTYMAAWYGNRYDLAERGGTTTFGPNWTPDPTNTNHGEERVPVTFTVTAAPVAGSLSITPAGGLTSTGTFGGPFTPPSQAYQLSNPGGTSINWTATNAPSWVTVSPASGTLAAGASPTTVTVSLNTSANSLAASTTPYTGAVTFTNATNGTGNTTRAVSLTVTDMQGDPALNVTVTPEDGATDVPVTTVITGTSTDSTDISTVFNDTTFALRANSTTMSTTRAGDEEHYRHRDGDDDDSDCIRSGVVVGTIAYDAGRTNATFTPICKLAHGMTYTATITPAVSVQQGSAVAAPTSWSFTTIASTPDTDDDGVEDGEDDHPDDDGEATPPKSKGHGKHKISVERYPGARLRNVTGISDTHSGINQAGKPAGYEFRDGLVDYEIQGVPTGGTVEVDLTLSEPAPAGIKVYTVGPAGFQEVVKPSIQGDTLTLKLTDGGAGDSDGVANGVIVNPVGVAVPVASGSGSLDLSNSSSGGGCTVAPGSASGGAGAVAPLVLLLIGMAVRRLRKPGRKQ